MSPRYDDDDDDDDDDYDDDDYDDGSGDYEGSDDDDDDDDCDFDETNITLLKAFFKSTTGKSFLQGIVSEKLSHIEYEYHTIDAFL